MMLRLHEKMILTLSAPLVEAPYLTIPQQVIQLPQVLQKMSEMSEGGHSARE
jgi:hypothetical protein